MTIGSLAVALTLSLALASPAYAQSLSGDANTHGLLRAAAARQASLLAVGACISPPAHTPRQSRRRVHAHGNSPVSRIGAAVALGLGGFFAGTIAAAAVQRIGGPDDVGGTPMLVAGWAGSAAGAFLGYRLASR